eukprot:gene30287-40257_t
MCVIFSPDNISVTSKMSLLEKLIMYRYFGRKQGLPELVQWMHNQVSRLEASRPAIFQAVRLGFAAAYDNLVEDPSLIGGGIKVAMEIWPDSIIERPPVHLQVG